MVESDRIDGFDEVRVVLRLPMELGGERVQVLGDWNSWSLDAPPMARHDHEFVTTITLLAGRTYQFRYLVDGVRWENDPAAHDYRPNGFGGYDSVIDLTRPS